MTQHGFFFDQSRCSGCHSCAVACKSWHRLEPGPLKYLKIYEYEKGVFPNIRMHFQWIPCYHCENPVCIDSCPCDAMHKEPKYGAVLIETEKCDGCRLCYDACPYGAPSFESDEPGVPAKKCNMCIDRLERSDLPICVLACPNRALDFGPLDTMQSNYGKLRDLEDLPAGNITTPAVVFKPHSKKRQLVPYDEKRALELLMKRDPLPQIFSSPSDVTDVPEGMVGRSKLVLKHQSAEELMRHTRNDEG